MKINKILVSQPTPTDPKSPYYEVASSNNVTIDFRSFIQVEGLDAKTFRKQRIDILSYSAIVFTSKFAVDHFFRLCTELRVAVPEMMKYFCISESIAVYLQKYTVYRKRKIFHAAGKFAELVDIMKKHKEENYLVPLSDVHKEEIPLLLDKAKLTYKIATFYCTVSSDLHDVDIKQYDLLVFFSPQGIASLRENFPDFEQNDTAIAAFGPVTGKAVTDAGLRLDLQAPTPECPSMTMAIDNFVKRQNKK
mgnify:CR=1 FL=1